MKGNESSRKKKKKKSNEKNGKFPRTGSPS